MGYLVCNQQGVYVCGLGRNIPHDFLYTNNHFFFSFIDFLSLSLFKNSTINLTHRHTRRTDLIFLSNNTMSNEMLLYLIDLLLFQKFFRRVNFLGRRVLRRAHRPLQSTSRLVVTTPGYPTSQQPDTRKKVGEREKPC